MPIRSGLCGACLLLFAATPARAERFENSYVAFALPDDWRCVLEKTEWVCSPPANAAGKRAMIVILTAKLVGPSDSPQTYLHHIQALAASAGVEVLSPPTERWIGRATWLDATLSNTEVPGYHTRYLARTEGRLGVLVTFSAHRSVAAEGRSISERLARSVAINPYGARMELPHD